MDIGCEDSELLKTYTKQLGARAIGLNIDEGFVHYERNKEGIIFYDG